MKGSFNLRTLCWTKNEYFELYESSSGDIKLIMELCGETEKKDG